MQHLKPNLQQQYPNSLVSVINYNGNMITMTKKHFHFVVNIGLDSTKR